MKTSFKTLAVLAAGFIVVVNASAALPPVPPTNRAIHINNNSAAIVNWHYKATYGACSAQPSAGVVLNGEGGRQTTVSCAYTADGGFTLLDAQTNVTVGKVDSGYAPCRVVTSTSPYQVAANPEKGKCVITINEASAKH